MNEIKVKKLNNYPQALRGSRQASSSLGKRYRRDAASAHALHRHARKHRQRM